MATDNTNTTQTYATKAAAKKGFERFLGGSDDGCNFDAAFSANSDGRWSVMPVFTLEMAEKFPHAVAEARTRFGDAKVLNSQETNDLPAMPNPGVTDKPSVDIGSTVDKSPTPPPAEAKSVEQPKANVVRLPVKKSSTPGLFREGSKRRWFYDALCRPKGVTAKQGAEFSGWSEQVAQSEFYEVSRKTGRTLVHETDNKGVKVYRLAE